MSQTATKINVTSLEYTRIAHAASRAAAEEIQKIVDIRDALTPIKFVNRELGKKGSLSHLKRTDRAAIKELAVMGTKSKGVATARQATLAANLGVCRRTITRTLAKLESDGIISREKTRTASGRQGADIIIFTAYRDHLNSLGIPVKTTAGQPEKRAIQSDKNDSSRVTKCHPFFTDRVEPDTESELVGYDEYCELVAETSEPLAKEQNQPIQVDDYPKTPGLKYTSVRAACNDVHEHHPAGRELFNRPALTVLHGGLAHV